MKNKTIKYIAKAAVTLLLSAVFLVNVAVAITSLTGSFGKWDFLPGAFLSVTSGSMEPELSVGDMVFAWQVPVDKLSVGDTVVYAGDGELITHRIVSIQEDTITARGLSNKFDDLPFSKDAYCGKMVFKVAGGSWLITLFTSLPGVVLYLFLIALLCYGYPLTYWIVQKIRKEKSVREKSQRIKPLRVALSLCLASFILLTPYATSAKYIAKLNEFVSASSLETNFSSNYLSEGGHDYFIQGWAGLTHNMDLTFTNMANDLRYNKAGTDVTYKVTFEKVDSEGETTYETAYEIVVTPDIAAGDISLGDENGPFEAEGDGDGDGDETTPTSTPTSTPTPTSVPDEDTVTWYTLHGNDDRAALEEHTFAIAIESTLTDDGGETIALPADTVICFKVTAETTSDEGYYRKLEGRFVFQVAHSTTFIGSQTLNQSLGSSLITYSITTNMVYGAGVRNVVFEWDSEKLSLNTYEPTAFNIILTDSTRYNPSYVDPDNPDDPPRGRLVVPLQGYSRVDLQFFKHNPNELITEGTDISVTEETSGD